MNKKLILQFLNQQLKEGKRFVFAGVIEDYMRTANGSKGETTSRILRYMREDKEVESIMLATPSGKEYIAFGLPTEQINLI